MAKLPHPVTVLDELVKAVHDRLEEQNELLRQLLDRMPVVGELALVNEPRKGSVIMPMPTSSYGLDAPAGQADTKTTTPAEPEPSKAPAAEGDAGNRDDEQAVEAVQVTEPAPSQRPVKKAAAKKTTGKRADRPAD